MRKHSIVMIFNLIPFKQVGPFVFFENIKSYCEYNFDFIKCDDKTGWDSYKLGHEGIELYTENNSIISIACRKELRLNHTNLIGLSLDSFLNKYGLKPSKEEDKIYIPDDDNYQDVIEFDEIGLQIWLKGNKIETVFCSPQLS
jgi:hypothetical protein